MDPVNILIQSTVIDLLQSIVARGEIDPLAVQVIEAVIIGKLYYCVHVNRLNLQNKLLHLLHSLISASAAGQEEVSRRGSRHADGASEFSRGLDGAESGSQHPVNPLLIQTLVDGISTPANRPVLQHWLDFILMAVPQFQPMLHVVVTPLNDCLCRQLRANLVEITHAASKEDTYGDDILASGSDAEFIMLLNGLERMVLLSLADTSEDSTAEDEIGTAEKSPLENSGILGYVSNVFGSETTPQNSEQLTVCH